MALKDKMKCYIATMMLLDFSKMTMTILESFDVYSNTKHVSMAVSNLIGADLQTSSSVAVLNRPYKAKLVSRVVAL